MKAEALGKHKSTGVAEPAMACDFLSSLSAPSRSSSGPLKGTWNVVLLSVLWTAIKMLLLFMADLVHAALLLPRPAHPDP